MRPTASLTNRIRFGAFFTTPFILLSLLLVTFSFPPPNSHAFKIRLTWDVPIDEEGAPIEYLKGYKVYMGTAPGDYTQVYDVGNATSYTVDNLSNATNYYFAITAIDADDKESNYSNEVITPSLAPFVPRRYQNKTGTVKMGTVNEANAEPWVGLYFTPQANTNNDHGIFMTDFETMVQALKSKGFNTIVFDMNYGAYHFTSDTRLNNWSYPAGRGFTSEETKRMAGIARAHDMKVIVAFQILTHSVGNVFPRVYPEFMLAASNWQAGVTYFAPFDYVQYGGVIYRSIVTHISDLSNAPPAASYWQTSVSDTRDPFNKDGEAIIFRMIDELIDAFTVNGIKPEGFHIESDELGCWYHDPVQTTGITSAQIYAMVITNAYNHIKSKNPYMEVIMWSDMLDPSWNGARARKNTALALDMIPKPLIIADWRYEVKNYFGYDAVKEIFPSVTYYLDKGFRVWTASWCDVKATTDLVWTGNMGQARTGRVMGHIYTTWLSGIVPELVFLLDDPAYQVSDSVLSVYTDDIKKLYRQYYRGIADSINATSSLIGIKQCRGSDYFCGIYPACDDLSKKSWLYDSEYRNYYCSNNQSAYKIVNFPSDYVSYWKFHGDVIDAAGRNNGIAVNGASIVIDIRRGSVAGFQGVPDFIVIPNSATLNMGTGSLSIGAWFKVGDASDFSAIVSKGLTTYSLLLHQDGRVVLETNGNDFYRYTKYDINYRDNKWHHVLAVFNSSLPNIDIYVDGSLANGWASVINGGNVKENNSELFLGNNNGSGQYQYNGLLDDVMIFNRSLSPAEVKLLYTWLLHHNPLRFNLRITSN